MNDAEILARIQKVYNSVIGNSDTVLTPETRLIRSKEIGSFILMELVIAIEDEFNIELTYSAIKSIKTVQGLIRYIRDNGK